MKQTEMQGKKSLQY